MNKFFSIFLIVLLVTLITGNVFAAPTQTLSYTVIDNWTDNDYTNNPTWTVVDGTWTAAAGYLASSAADGTIYTGKHSSQDANIAIETIGWKFEKWTDVAGEGYFFLLTNDTGNNNNSNWTFILRGAGNNCSIYKNGTGTLVWEGNCGLQTNAWDTIEIIRDANSTWELAVNDTVYHVWTDTTYESNNNYYKINTTGGSVNTRIENLAIGKTSGVATADITATTNASALSIDFNSTHVRPQPSNSVATDWNWVIDDVISSFDENFVFTPIVEYTDYNACVNITFADANQAYTCETYNSGKIYGDTNFYFFDETTGLATSATIDFNGTEYTGTSFYLPTKQITNNSNTNAQYTFTITKTNYGTRYYTVDLNQFSDLNVGFTLLPDASGRNIEFQLYKTDEITLYTNTYVELLVNDQAYRTAGRRKTSTTAKATFFVNPNDANYTIRIYGSDGTQDYNSMVLTVNHPKDESTATQIDGNWSLDVTGLAWQTYTDLNGNQTVQIYANTVNDYGLTVGDVLANYYDRKYYVSYVGATTAATLQPYLVDINNAVSTTIYTLSAYTQEPVGGIVIKIYKTIPIDGRVLVEQVTTDAKGEALVSMIANEEYEFEIYDDGVLLGAQVYSVTSTSTTIYISLDDVGLTKPILQQGYVDVLFTPGRAKLITSDTSLTQTIQIVDNNLGITFTNALIYITNTDVNGISGNDSNVWVKTITTQSNTIVLDTALQTLDGNSYDTNGVLIVYVMVTTSQGQYFEKHVYSPVKGFDLYQAIGFNLRPTFGCPATNDPLIPCGPMLFIALFVAILGTVAFAIETGFTGQESMAVIFLAIMGLFAYFGWVPYGLLALIVVSVIMLMIAIGGRNKL